MEEKKVSLFVSFIAFVFVILLCVASAGMYQKQKLLERTISDLSLGRVGNFDVQYVENNIGDLQQKITNIEQKQNGQVNSPTKSTLDAYESLLLTLASEQFFKENSIKYNGGLRLRFRSNYLFSVDIPASTYKKFPETKFSVSYSSVKDSLAQTNILFYPGKDGKSLLSNDFLSLQSFYYYNFPDTISCSSSSNIEVQMVASVVRQLITDDSDLQRYGGEKFDSIDLCKYITPHKELTMVSTDWLQRTLPNLISPPIYKGSEGNTWKGFVFDFYKLKEDYLLDNSGVPHTDPVLFIAVPLPDTKQFGSRDARVLKLSWYPGLYPDSENYIQNKEAFVQARELLNKTIDSIAESTVLLPICEYGCSY